MGVPQRTIYDWINYWHKKGYNGLKDRPSSEGRPPRLGKE
jgi:transposase